MSRYIEVNHKVLEQAAAEMDQYIDKHNQLIEEAGDAVRGMSAFWDGDDYIQYSLKWETFTNGESTSKALTKNVKTYADFLRLCASKYKEAQTNAVNRANQIPLW